MVVVRYRGDPDHLAVRVAWPAGEYLERHALAPPGTHVFAADLVSLLPLDAQRHGLVVERNFYNRERERTLLASLPSGSVGVWSNSDTARGLGVAIEDLPSLGYEELARFEETVEYEDDWRQYRPWVRPEVHTLRYAVVKKR